MYKVLLATYKKSESTIKYFALHFIEVDVL